MRIPLFRRGYLLNKPNIPHFIFSQRFIDHFDDFVAVLGESETLLLLEVYAAGEAAIAGASAEALAQAIRVRRGVEPVVVSDQRELAAILIDVLKDRDILLMQGAGDIGRLSATLSDCGSLEVLL